jgi:hypothetical protein
LGRTEDARRVLEDLLRRRQNDSDIVHRLRAISGE